MSEDRRLDPRSRLAGVYATYESATGERHGAQVFDLGRGGLFLKTESPAAVGRRLAVEIAVTGESTPWETIGRVVWTREASFDDDHPAGMALKLIAVDDAVSDRLARLVHGREPTVRGIGPLPPEDTADATPSLDGRSPAAPPRPTRAEEAPRGPTRRSPAAGTAIVAVLIAAALAVAYAWSR